MLFTSGVSERVELETSDSNDEILAISMMDKREEICLLPCQKNPLGGDSA